MAEIPGLVRTNELAAPAARDGPRLDPRFPTPTVRTGANAHHSLFARTRAHARRVESVPCTAFVPFAVHAILPYMDLEELDAWADRVLDDRARVTEHLTEAELHDRSVVELAESFACADGWSIGPDDPALRTYLIDGESISDAMADAVIAKLRELGAAHGWT